MQKFDSCKDWSYEDIDRCYRHIEETAAEFQLDYYPNQIEIISSEQMLDAYCITPDHKLLRQDLRWVEAGTIKVGDVILGFDEEGPHRAYRSADVTNITRATEPVYMVTLSSGKQFKVTGEHRWLVRQQKGETSQLLWRTTLQLRGRNHEAYTPSRIPKVCEVWDELQTKDAGWLAGMYDGEGNIVNGSAQTVAISQNKGQALDRIKHTLTEHAYTFYECDKPTTPNCKTIGITGSSLDRLRFLGEFRPERLISKIKFDNIGLMKTSTYEEVDTIESIGNHEIVKITTSTGTFICDGYPMHNCAVGMPIYYSHWSFGKEFIRNQEMYNRGYMGLAYEIVINSNPCISYLMEENTMTMQALVMAHACIGHNNFFKNNHLFKQWTDADSIIDFLDFAKYKINEYEEKYGANEVEATLDVCHSLRYNGIDRYKRPSERSHIYNEESIRSRRRFDEETFNDIWRTIPHTDKNTKITDNPTRFPEEPEENLLYFLEKHAPNIPQWKREIIRIVRKISQYFYPQMLTKIMNEGWSCLEGESLIVTNRGMIKVQDIVDQNFTGKVDDGTTLQNVINWFQKPNKKRIKIHTNKGYSLHGGEDHKIFVSGKWIEMKDLRVGDTISLTRGRSIWNDTYQQLTFVKPTGRNTVTQPTTLTEDLAYLVGLVIGDGCIYNKRYSFINLTSKDQELLSSFERIITDLFGVNSFKKADKNHWNIRCNSKHLVDFFRENFSLTNSSNSFNKQVPDIVLQSPEAVVASFIRGHVDTDGHVDKYGNIIIVSNSRCLLEVEQQLLLNMGIVCSLKKQRLDNCFRLTIQGSDSLLFQEKVGFSLQRKKQRLFESHQTKQWYKTKNDTVTIVNIEHDEGEVYDFSVENTHQYKASCFINHNCFWHYTIINEMYDRGLVTDGFMMEFLHNHTGVIYQRQYSAINPYALGFAMFQDIKRISMEPTDEDKKWFPEWAGNGNWVKTLKDAAYNYKDESFILQFLSPKVMRDFRFFHVLDDDLNPTLIVKSIHNDRGYKEVRETLAHQQNANNHIPNIQVVNVDVWGDRHVYLQHYTTRRHTLEHETALQTLHNFSKLWGYTTKMQTIDSSGNELEKYEIVPIEIK